MSEILTLSQLLNTRKPDRIKQKLSVNNGEITILKSSSDWGTVLNNGRRGSFAAPSALLSQLFKMADHDFIKSFSIHEVSDPLLEKNNFQKAQDLECERIKHFIKKNSKTIHLGGGHDHIFPLLKAYDQLGLRNILVINIDPHLDTRTDFWQNSGTPFRNWDQISEGKNNSLIQFGTHYFANGKSNYEPLNHLKQEILDFHFIQNQTSCFTDFNLSWFFDICENFPFDHLFVSLDIDAYQAESMKAVSAVNQKGFSPLFLENIFEGLKKYNEKTLGFGLYEFNPLYDDISGSSARVISALIFEKLLKT